jgi:hypothetical protein
MIGVAALLNGNGVKFVDNDHFMEFDYPGFGEPLRIAKDGYSDNYRLQEAVERKVKGGKGMIALPNLSGQVAISEQLKWEFKDYYDKRHEIPVNDCNSGRTRWGGSFQTKAIDYDDDVEYTALDLSTSFHYFNILLTAREKKDFEAVNPGLYYEACEEDCLTRPHFHGVHGCYPEANLGPVHCAPSFEMFNRWANLIPMLNPLVAATAEGEKAKGKAPVREERRSTPLPEERSERPVEGKGENGKKGGKKSAGAYTLKTYMEDCPPWSQVQETYRTPEAAKWADTGLYSSSNSGQRKLKQKWNTIYTEKILPMVGGKGSPVQSVLKRAWDIDSDHKKVIANYCIRRLTSGDSGVVETEDGMLIAEAE